VQVLDLNEHGLPDLQFVLMVLALCTSDLDTLNVPDAVCLSIFDRCWALVHATPPPERREERVLDLRNGTALTLDAMVTVIKSTLAEHGIMQLTWDHPPSAPTRATTPEVLPLIERLQQLYPAPPAIADDPPTP
jgi:hypothetical protein